jgi:hypothetical protein
MSKKIIEMAKFYSSSLHKKRYMRSKNKPKKKQSQPSYLQKRNNMVGPSTHDTITTYQNKCMNKNKQE